MRRSNSKAWLEVITDAASIAEARRLALAKTDSRVEQLMRKPEEFRYENIHPIVKANASVLVPAWRGLAASAREPFARRLVAARFLCDQRDDGGLAFLIDTIRADQEPERREALSLLHRATCDDAAWLRGHVQQLGPALLSLLKRFNDDLIPMAARLCKDLNVPGAVEKALELWRMPLGAWARRAVLEQLVPREAKTAERLGPIEATLRPEKLPQFVLSEALQCAAAYLDSPDPESVRRSLEVIERRFPWTSRDLTTDAAGVSSLWDPVIVEAGKRGARAAVPLLEKFLRSRLNVGYRGSALKALAHVLGAEVLPYVDESMGETRLAFAVAEALGIAFRGSGEARAIERLQKLAARTNDEFAHDQITAALKGIGGSEAREAARKQLADSPPLARQDLKALVDGTTLSRACARLAAIGLIPSFSTDDIQAMQAKEKRDVHDPAWSLLVLDHAHIRTCFDAESNDVPAPHDELIRDFAQNSRGVFTPAAVSQWETTGRKAGIWVQFVFNDRLYRFQAQDLGDYYDAERVVASIHRALADAGHSERFLSRDTGDQVADFIFGEPRIILEAAREFDWCLDEQFNSLVM